MSRQIETLTGQTSTEPKVSHAALLMGSQIVRWLLRLAFVLVVARTLGPKGLGLYALIFTVVEFLAVASGAGYADYLTREAAKDVRIGWGLGFQLVVLRMAIAIPVAAIEICILALLRYPRPVLAGTAWLALTIMPRSLSEAVQGVFRGIRQYTINLIIEMVLGGSLLAGALVLIMRHGQLQMAVSIEVLAASMAGLAALIFAMKFRTRERICLSRLKLLKRGAVFNAYSLIANVYDRFDVALLSKLAGDYATGIYSVAYRALGMTQIVGYSVLYSLLPNLSRDGSGHVERRRLERAMGFLLSAALFVVLAATVYADRGVLLILGSQYAESAEALKILIWAVVFRYLNYALNIALLAAGREHVFVKTSFTCMAVNLAGNLVLIPRFGWRAAAIMTIATELALLIQNVYWSRRTLGHVALPWAGIRSSLAFVVALTIALGAQRLASSLLVGTGCILLYAAYLYRSGMVTEFATAWSPKGSLQREQGIAAAPVLSGR